MDLQRCIGVVRLIFGKMTDTEGLFLAYEQLKDIQRGEQ